jgi:hypothetical protein
MQIEVWSARTTKKIIYVLLVVYLVVEGSFFVLKRWINPLERHAAVQVFEDASKVRHAKREDLGNAIVHAESSEKLAENRKWTIRDQRMAGFADNTIFFAKKCRSWELGLIPPLPESFVKQHEDLARQRDESEKSWCSNYELADRLGRDALRSRLGF